jgi:hypothetical protein
MYYIIQENLFNESGYYTLIDTLNKFSLDYEVVTVPADNDDIIFHTQRKDVFVFGSLKLGRISKQYDWYPGSLITKNHDFNVYKNFYKENLLNYHSKIYKFGEDFEWKLDKYFIRPCLDSKVFTGKVFTKEEWLGFKNRVYTTNYSKQLTNETLIQVALPKFVTKEVRLWVINGIIVTSSVYRYGSHLVYDTLIDVDALEFGNKMLELYQLADVFTMDVGLTEEGWKIVECGSISCAGFYMADMQRLIMELEDFYDRN